jgi:hypothetical protein
MIENWTFWVALFLGSLLALFHGLVLLFAPAKYIPTYAWGEASLKLTHKESFQWGKRFLGLCSCVLIGWLFTRPAISWMLHPTRGELSGFESSAPHDMARWDRLAIGVFALACGCFLFLRPEKAVEAVFSADKSKLQDRATRMLWTIYIEIFALCIAVWSLLPFGDFIKSLR